MVAEQDKVQSGLAGQDGVQPSIRTILVVDDSRLERRILASSLRRWGYTVLEAENARVAMDLCKSSRPDLIFSDWVMPGMSGPEFCRAFRAMGGDKYGYFILLTSKSEATEIAHGLNAGADDFLIKPVSPDEMRARIAAGDRILRMERELSEKNRVISETLAQLQGVYQKIDADLVQARKIQEALVPLRDPVFGPARVSLLLEPCGHIGGDLVGAFSPMPDQVAFYGIDVSGHGITSAMLTARIGSYLSATHLEQNIAVRPMPGGGFELRDPVEVAQRLNDRFSPEDGIDQYFTMAYGTADLKTGQVQLVQAGHPNPVLLRADGSADYVGTGGFPLGLLDGASFEQVEIQLNPGDRLLLHSDGFTECPLDPQTLLGEERFLDMVKAARPGEGPDFLEDLFWQLAGQMEEGISMDDDVSATVFHYTG